MYHTSRVTLTEGLDEDFYRFSEVNMDAATVCAFSDCSQLFTHKLLHFAVVVCMLLSSVVSTLLVFPGCS